MKIDTAIVTLRGVRMGIAFPHSTWVRPGVGDQLINRLAPFMPTLPIMLVCFDEGEERAYAAFQTKAFFEALNLDEISLVEIDLDAEPPEEELPF